MRNPYEVLVFPYIKDGKNIKYVLFKRADLYVWQAIAGGGEDEENILLTAKREAKEEAGISMNSKYIRLTAVGSIPAKAFSTAWGKDIIVIPEFAFGVEVDSEKMTLSDEHTQYIWVNFKTALELLKWDNDKTALFELHYRLFNDKLEKKQIAKNSRIFKKYL